MNKFEIITAIIAAIAIACAAILFYGIQPAFSRTVNACTSVKLPSSGCTTTHKVIHGFKVTIKVCK